MNANDEVLKKSYYAIIPADVRYDDRLPMGARFLYGEITALCNEKGYCWASNKYFAELYKVTNRTIINWINSLIEYNYVFSDLKFRENSKEIESRYLKIISLGSEKNFTTSGKFFHTPSEKIFTDNNTLDNNTFNTILSKDNIVVVGENKQPQPKKNKKFKKPTIEEIKAYCIERKNGIDANYFFDYYESKGWLIGKNPMKDWKAAIRTWEKKEFSKGGVKNGNTTTEPDTGNKWSKENAWNY